MSKHTENACPVRKTSIGGQALMEGIMMRGPKMTAMAVRNPKGEIVVEKFPTATKPRPAILKWPIIRGVVGFIDSLTFGYKCLMRSAEISGLEELEAEMEREKAEKKAAKKAAKLAKKGITVEETVEPAVEDATAPEGESAEATEETTATPAPEKPAEKKESSMSGGIMVVSVLLALCIAVGLFMGLPSLLYDYAFVHLVSLLEIDNAAILSIIRSTFEGVLRVIFLIGYMSLMLLMKDIRRTFQFHGAEHKTIFCYEHGLELTVENIRQERRFHPRCGTSFLILMMLVSIVVGIFIPEELHWTLRVLCKLAVFPLIMGLGYELIKFCGKHDNWLTRLISLPGVWLQHITVLEPDDAMIECAIVAMKEVIPEDDSDAW